MCFQCNSLLTPSIKSIVRPLATAKAEFALAVVDADRYVEVKQIGARVFQIIDINTGEASFHSIGEAFQ